MSEITTIAERSLNQRYLADYPLDAAKRIEGLPDGDVQSAIAELPVEVLAPVWLRMAPEIAADLLAGFSEERAAALIAAMDPIRGVAVLGQFDPEDRERHIDRLPANFAREVRRLLSYPEESAGRLMDTRFVSLRPEMTVAEALQRLRRSRLRGLHSVFVVDDRNRLTARIAIHELAIADLEAGIDGLAEPDPVAVNLTAPREEIVELLERFRMPNIPVTDLSGRLVGVVRYATLVDALQATTTANIQTMVGASAQERALSKPIFAVRKRLPWLQINLLTAFLAAAVVGLFEATIAKFTALAVLLPVVAGQSGNAGAQALAVTMRGLALREITVRDAFGVTLKEVNVGFLNGIAVALTCAVGVYFWSGSFGLVLVIAISMVLAMVAAGFAGAMVPIVLTRLGQDPAQSSSIVLTTVTDIAGFFSFLGIATLLSALL